DFGDGNTSTQIDPVHVYGVCKDTFDVLLTTYGSDSSCNDQQTESVVISSGIVSDFSYVQQHDQFTFTNLSTGASSYLWDFGDGMTSMSQNESHQYSTPPFDFTVTLKAMAGDTSCFEITQQMMHILAPGIKPNNLPKIGLVQGDEVSIIDGVGHEYQVFNILGVRMGEPVRIRTTNHIVATQDLDPGVYLIRSITQQFTFKFVNR
ncbi:MAG: PKD domain-containing protein, partial [Bacteroidetes bacterium]|nr:PKD domain-containing protein [Bacteroidota bacterium]